jgi:uncharacterized membrane protein
MERLSFTLALLFCSASSHAASLTALPNTSPYAISVDGSTIVGGAWEAGDQYSQAFRWTSSAGLQRLGPLPGDYASAPVALSADGSVVAGNSLHWEPIPGDPDGLEAYRGFRWTAATGLTDLGLLPGALTTEVRAISADGSAVFGSALFPGYSRVPFRWTEQTGIVPLHGPTHQGVVVDVSADGSVAVVQQMTQPVRWTAAGGLAPLAGLPAGNHYATAISADGSTIAGHSWLGSSGRLFRWSEHTQTLDYITDLVGHLRLVSDDGRVLAGEVVVDGVWRAFRWTEETGLQVLERPLGTRSDRTYYPSAMSADGSVLVGRLDNSYWNGSTWTGHDAYVWTAETGSTRLTSLLESYGIGLPTGWYWLELDAVSADGTTFVGSAARRIPYGEFSVIVTIPEPSLLPFVLALIPPLLRRRAAARRGGTIHTSDVSLPPGGHP